MTALALPASQAVAGALPRGHSPRVALDLPFQVDILAGQLAGTSLARYARDVRAYLWFAGSAEAALAPETLARPGRPGRW